MLRTALLTLVAVGVLLTGGVIAQDNTQRGRELAAALDKNKYKKKTKRDLTIEIYIDIKNAAAVRSDPAEYSGVYTSDGYKLELRAAGNGDVTGSGYDTPNYDDSKPVKFTLRNGRIDSAVLTGVKEYENGETRKFEAVFVDRTVTSGKNVNEISAQHRSFGLGWVESGPTISGGSSDSANQWTSRVFLERR